VRLLLLTSTIGSGVVVYIIADIDEHDFSNSFACSMMSGKLERINFLLPSPEYIIFLNILTIISAGMTFPEATMLRNSYPI
jgi:hypothetical protein